MLGRYHTSISIATVLPFIIPLIFLENHNLLTYGISLLLLILAGSLIPDSDCAGKSKLHYDFYPISIAMTPIKWITYQIFRLPKIRYKYKLDYETLEGHRGIMHSPIGILISSLLLTAIFTFILVFIKSFNLVLISISFIGLFLGQFLHLLEDSCTVSGIDWKRPFGTKLIRGNISTFDKESDKTDVRPLYYTYTLSLLSLILFLGYAFGEIKLSLGIIYPILLSLVSLIWICFLVLAQSKSSFWLQNKEKVNNLKKSFKINPRRLEKEILKSI